MALASPEDLAALGGLTLDESASSAKSKRAARLLELASAQVLAYLRLDTEDDVAVTFTEPQRTVIAAVVAEAAASRLTVSAAPSTDPFIDPSVGAVMSSLLSRRHYRTLDKLLGRGGRGSTSIAVDRAEETTFLTYSQAGARRVYIDPEADDL